MSSSCPDTYWNSTRCGVPDQPTRAPRSWSRLDRAPTVDDGRGDSASDVGKPATNAGAHDALPTAAQPLGWSYPSVALATIAVVSHTTRSESGRKATLSREPGRSLDIRTAASRTVPMACSIGVLWLEPMTATQSAFLSRRADFDSQNLAQNCVALGALYHGTGTSQLDLGPSNNAAR